jgi:hypothetical protein
MVRLAGGRQSLVHLPFFLSRLLRHCIGRPTLTFLMPKLLAFHRQ